MIQITYNEVGDVMILRAEGHAGFAPKGQDIVCAAVSTLMQTLAYSLDVADGGAVATVNQGGGQNALTVQASQSSDNRAKFEFVLDGLYLLADAYPEHVRYINLHADKTDAIDLQLFADGGGDGGDASTSSVAGATASPQGEALGLPAMRPAEERLARRSGVMKRSASHGDNAAAADGKEPLSQRKGADSSPNRGAPAGPATEGSGRTSQSPDGDSSPKGRANASAGAAAADGEEPLGSTADGMPSQSPDGDSSPKGRANASTGAAAADGEAKSPEERRAAFRQMLTGEYSDLAEEMMQNAVNEAAKRLEASPAMKGLMQALAEKYGTDANDLAALTEAVKNGAVKDDAYYEKLAMEKGVSTKTARELDKLESQNKRLTEQQQMIQQMERQRAQNARIAEMQAGWDREAEALKAQYPDFNMTEVLANPEVAQMMRSGVSMTNAYRSAYFDHILKQQQAATAQQVEKGVIDRVQQRNARPSENGTRPGGAVQSKIDVAHLSRRECEELEKRVARGEIITF